jgi:hypothetical protein
MDFYKLDLLLDELKRIATAMEHIASRKSSASFQRYEPPKRSYQSSGPR